DPTTHSEMIPVLGNKGAGKTHLLHSIKHGGNGAWQLLVTPGVYQRDSEFLEYLLFQIIDTVLSGGRQRGVRPLEYIGEEIARRQLIDTLESLQPQDKRDLFATGGVGRWTRLLGFGQSAAVERAQGLIDALRGHDGGLKPAMPVRKCIEEFGL